MDATFIGVDLGLVLAIVYILEPNLPHYLWLRIGESFINIRLQIYRRLFELRFWVYDRDQWDDFYENNNSDQSNESIVTYSKTNPKHYQRGSYQIWDFIVDQQLDFLAGNIIKYICRAGYKNQETELDDWLKVKAYVERKLQQLSHERNR